MGTIGGGEPPPLSTAIAAAPLGPDCDTRLSGRLGDTMGGGILTAAKSMSVKADSRRSRPSNGRFELGDDAPAADLLLLGETTVVDCSCCCDVGGVVVADDGGSGNGNDGGGDGSGNDSDETISMEG